MQSEQVQTSLVALSTCIPVEQTTPFNGEYLNSSLVEQLELIQFVAGSIPVSNPCQKLCCKSNTSQ